MSLLRGLAYSSVVVPREARMAVMREWGMAQWFRRLRVLPCGFVVVARGWYRSRRAARAGRKCSPGRVECVRNCLYNQEYLAGERRVGETIRPSG